MIWLLKFLIFGHAHKWETESKELLDYVLLNGRVDRGVRFICRCTRCGSIRKFDCF